MARGKAQVRVCYETITDESARDGDFADHGWIQPETEAQRSLRAGGKRAYERNLRMARARKFDWRLRDAFRFIEKQCCEAHEGQVDSRLCVRAMGEYHASQYEQLQRNYSLHVDGVSDGTLARLTRVLRAQGVRFS